MVHDASLPHASSADLRAVRVFRSLPEATLSSLAQISHPESYHAGQVLFEEDQEGDSLYVLLQGSATIQKVIDRESEAYKDLAVVDEGDVLGEMAIFENKPRSATVRALTNLSVLRIYREEFDDFLRRDASTASVVLGGLVALMSSRLRESGLHVVALYEIGNLIATSGDPVVLAQGVLERLSSTIGGVAGAAFCTWQAYQDESEIVASHGVAPEGEQGLAVQRGGPVYRYLQANRSPFVMPELEEDHPLRLAFPMESGDSLLMAPLFNLDDVLGFIILLRRNDPFTSFHKVLLSAAATQVGSALKNLMHAKEAEARSRLEAARANPLLTSW